MSRIYSHNQVLAIIPAHNEAAGIGPIVVALKARGLKVVVIDDFSTDDTVAVARRNGATVLRLTMNLGYSGALQTGYLYAKENGYSTVLQIDGDGQHDPADAAAVLAPVLAGETDVVIGSRFLGGHTYRIPLARRVGQAVFAALAGWLSGKPVTDPTSGYQALNRSAFELYLTPVFPDDYPDANMWVLLNRLKFRVMEVPVTMHGDGGRSMHAGFWKPFYYGLKMLLYLFMVRFAPLAGRDS